MSILGSAAKRYTRLFTSVTSVGNGADLTEDTLQTFVIPANTLVNVGDTLRIVAGGQMGATTDNKTARVKIGATNLHVMTETGASNTSWEIDIELVKTGTNTQVQISHGLPNNASISVTSSTRSFTDSGTLTLTVTGQNITNSVASSITCQVLTVDLIRA